MPNDEPEICQSTDVIVDGRLVARSIFAEFETKIDRPLGDLVQVLNPKSWPTYSAPLIRRMDPIDPVAPWPPASPNPWRQSFKEHAELGTETLTNVLQFDFSLSETYFALTFDLAHSVDGKLDLDRGYFLINDRDGRRRVQALKLIRFVPGHESDLSRFLVDEACPMWGDWIKAIIQAQPVASARNATGSGAAADPADLARLGAVIYRDRLLELVDTSRTPTVITSPT